jgi:N-formylglutamate amidohydrolase
VVRNKPYAGGFITEHYGEPALGHHALQIEINRGLYMDERSLAKKPRFETLQRDLADVFTIVTQEIGSDLTPRRIAAE